MPVQMLSGPDLGGGFLHQLSFESEADVNTFTFHAQDGGSDAGGPPAGPLDVFGYVHPPSPCMFGGPRCWHRRFRLDLVEAPRVRTAYNRGRFVLDAMIGQVYGSAPVPIDAGIGEVVERIVPSLEGEGVRWYIGGSSAARLLGVALEPHDLDLGTTRSGVDRIAEVLREFLIEPVGPTDWPGRGIVHGARAFVGTFREGVRVEWAVGLDTSTTSLGDEWDASSGAVRTEPVEVRGRPVRVTRPEYALVRATERGRVEVASKLTAWIRDHGTDQELLDELFRRSGISESERDRVRKALRGP
jgi:hypothetical protein